MIEMTTSEWILAFVLLYAFAQLVTLIAAAFNRHLRINLVGDLLETTLLFITCGVFLFLFYWII